MRRLLVTTLIGFFWSSVALAQERPEAVCPEAAVGCEQSDFDLYGAGCDDFFGVSLDSGWLPDDDGEEIQVRFRAHLGGLVTDDGHAAAVTLPTTGQVVWPEPLSVGLYSGGDGRLDVGYGVEIEVQIRYDLEFEGIHLRDTVDIPVPFLDDLPDVVARPDGVDLGDVRFGERAVTRLDVDNRGETPLRVDVSPMGPGIVAAPVRFTVPPGASQGVDVSIDPAVADFAAAGLLLSTNDPDAELLGWPITGVLLDPPQPGEPAEPDEPVVGDGRDEPGPGHGNPAGEQEGERPSGAPGGEAVGGAEPPFDEQVDGGCVCNHTASPHHATPWAALFLLAWPVLKRTVRFRFSPGSHRRSTANQPG